MVVAIVDTPWQRRGAGAFVACSGVSGGQAILESDGTSRPG